MLSWNRKIISVHILLTLSLVLLASCGSGPAARTPEEIHTQYIQAMTNLDREAIADLLAPELRTRVDPFMNDVRNIIAGNRLPPWNTDHGAFVGAEVLSVAERGQERVGVSVWRWERAVMCYQLIMAKTDAGYRVTEWWEASKGQVQQHQECTRSTIK